MIGKQILQYRILSLIGEGGMGAVWLAEHTHLSRKVAIKSLHAHLVRNEQLRLRFKNEAALLVQLQHPGIVNLIDYYEDSEGLYLILEYVDGTPLDDYIRNVSGPIPFEKASAWMLQILSAFSFAHGKNIVHRDIKPSNILITNEGQIKILDFGIAKLLNDSNAKLTRTGTQMGTVYYMSPEQVKGEPADVRSDIYSLGVTFYQMLTGQCPYDGMTSEFEVFNKIVSVPLPRASEVYPAVPLHIEYVIEAATSKDVSRRIQTCDQFAHAIQHALSQSMHAGATKEKVSPQPQTKTVASGEKTNWWAIIIPSAILVIAVVVILAVKESQPKEEITTQYVDEVAFMSNADYEQIISNYYTDLTNNAFDASNYYQTTVRTFIGLSDVTVQEIQDAAIHADFQNPVYAINPESFFHQEINDEHVVTFNMDMQVYRPSKEATQYCTVSIEICFDRNGMITSYRELEVTDLNFADTMSYMRSAN
ncbi:MAG: serine/threonine protein kinase [Bacteroidetes bacterium]|jgi:serine/threonine protein kinase|nr:serine/threonine protein kinase [Bacteroidota bacterium]